MYGTGTASLATDEDRCSDSVSSRRKAQEDCGCLANNAGHQAMSPNSLCYVKKNDRKKLFGSVECRSHRLTGVILSSSSCSHRTKVHF